MRESYGEAEDKRHFRFYYDDNQGKSITMNVSTSDGAYKIVKEFERFMKACGYISDLHLTIRGPSQDKNLAPRENVIAQAAKEERLAKPSFDFSNIPNNNWVFGTQPIPTLTTADISAMSVSPDPWTKNQFPTMAPLTTEQVYAWSADLPSSGGEKVRVQF
jgi:hypothetical protein